MHARSNDRRPVAPSGAATLATRLLVAALYALGVVFPLGLIMTPASASAQTSVVDVCTGVALPRSVVTDIVAPVIIGVATPIENTVNGLLSILAPRLNVGATALLASAARGDDITLRLLDVNGNAVNPANTCVNQADRFTLAEEAGISIGGNQITGLGSGGAIAIAGELNSIAFGNGSRTAATSADAIALGRTARVLANCGSVRRPGRRRLCRRVQQPGAGRQQRRPEGRARQLCGDGTAHASDLGRRSVFRRGRGGTSADQHRRRPQTPQTRSTSASCVGCRPTFRPWPTWPSPMTISAPRS